MEDIKILLEAIKVERENVKSQIIALVDDLIIDETLYGWNHSAKVLTELKQKIETL